MWMEGHLKHIDIVIPTRNRYEKLMKTLKSIPDNIGVYIIFDGDSKTYNLLQDKKLYTTKFLVSLNMGAVYCRNQVIKHCKDGVLYATDDIIFEPNSIESAFNALNTHFPDDDGVVGFVIDLPDWHPTGVALVGQKFLRRYPQKQLFNPDYFHFSCQEIYWLAKKLGKFYQEPKAVIKHYHPCFYKEEMDKTHEEARIYREKDHILMRKRKAKGLIWGDVNA